LARHDIVVIGTSSGGVEVLIRLFRDLPKDLPKDLPAAVFVVHIPQGASSVLPSLLNHAGSLKAVNPEDGDAIT
jgi:two-component system, chemotaxis family, protein-glutamate methylesterase/glutaminase